MGAPAPYAIPGTRFLSLAFLVPDFLFQLIELGLVLT
jgi:hypothetical protein